MKRKVEKFFKLLILLVIVIASSFLYRNSAHAAIGLGIESVYDDTVWMGWTIYESGTVGYGQAGGDGGKAYGRYQFDYRYALPDFLKFAYESDSEKYAMLEKYILEPAGSENLLSGNGLGADWLKAYNADKEGFSQLQDEFAYNYYYLPAKQALMGRGIDLDELNDPVIKGTVYSLAIRDGANDSGVRAAWQSYDAGISVQEWLSKIYDLESSRHPAQSNRWSVEQKMAALNGGVTTGFLSDLGTLMAANGATYTDYVKEWIEKYPNLAKGFVDMGGWCDDNREWASTLRSAGDWYKLYGIKGGALDFSGATSGGFYISDLIINAENLQIPDNDSSMPIVYMAQSGGQPWSSIPFGGGTIATSGCSVTSFAMVASFLRSDVDSSGWIYPSDVVSAISQKYGNYNHFYVDGSGQSWDIFSALANIYGIECNMISSASIVAELATGHPVIMSCKPGEFTSSGHFIVLTGITDDGYITVNDPNAGHAAYSYKKYPASYLAGQGKGWWSFSN